VARGCLASGVRRVTAVALPRMWLGPNAHEAVSLYHRAREAGLSVLRALATANLASFKEAWAFRKTIARQVGCSVRTVARALRQAREAGLIGVARAKRGERPKDEQGNPIELPCGFSHRWVIGWGEAGQRVKAAVEQARAKFMAKAIVNGKPGAPNSPRPRPFRPRSVEELERELARRYPPRPPPDTPS